MSPRSSWSTSPILSPSPHMRLMARSRSSEEAPYKTKATVLSMLRSASSARRRSLPSGTFSSRFRAVSIELRCVKRLDREPGPLMDRAAPLRQHGVVGDLLRQRVLEAVFDCADCRLFIDEFAELELREHLPQLIAGLKRHALHQVQRKFMSQHRKRLQQFLLRRRQAINARGDHGLYRGGDLNRAQRPGEPQRAIRSEEHTSELQ